MLFNLLNNIIIFFFAKQFSVVITQREGHLEASRLVNEDPIIKSQRAYPRIGYYVVALS